MNNRVINTLIIALINRHGIIMELIREVLQLKNKLLFYGKTNCKIYTFYDCSSNCVSLDI